MKLASGGISWARNRLARELSLVGKLAVVLGLTTMALGASHYPVNELWQALYAVLWICGFGALIGSFAVGLTRVWLPGEVEVTAGELVLRRGDSARGRSFPLEALRSAYVVDRPTAGMVVSTVEIETRTGDLLTVRVPDATQAHALVAALGFGPGRRPTVVRLGLPTRRLLHLLLAYLAYMIGSVVASLAMGIVGIMELVFPALAVATVAAHALLKRAFAAPEIVVGDDGVIVKKGLQSRFVPRAAIQAVSTSAPGIPLVIQLRTGAGLPLTGVFIDGERRVAAGRLLEDRIGRAPPAPERLPYFERRGLPLAGWREELARMMRDESYRTAAVSVEDATAVLKSPHASAEQRVGAALALRIAGEPDERIRVAAKNAADERVRVAIEAALEDGDDAAVDEALRRAARH